MGEYEDRANIRAQRQRLLDEIHGQTNVPYDIEGGGETTLTVAGDGGAAGATGTESVVGTVAEGAGSTEPAQIAAPLNLDEARKKFKDDTGKAASAKWTVDEILANLAKENEGK